MWFHQKEKKNSGTRNSCCRRPNPIVFRPAAFTDSMFAYILKRRLLISQFSAASSNTMCNVGGCKSDIGLSHPESCTASGILGRRHEALREVVYAMLSSVGLDCDRVDCTKNVLLTARLQAAKAVNPDGSFVKVGGIVHGADMIVRGLHQRGDEFALDFTVFSGEVSRDRLLAAHYESWCSAGYP